MHDLNGIANFHPLFVQGTPHAVQLADLCLCQAVPVLAQVVNVEVPDILLVL